MSASFSHTTVLREATARHLRDAPRACEGWIVDGTLGGGGHAEALLESGARVLGLDQDPDALEAASSRLSRFGNRFVARHANFRDLSHIVSALDGPLVGALVDLGVSSPQLDRAGRGFSFQRSGPLDMRMDTSQGPTLEQLLAGVEVPQLASILRTCGEEPRAGPIARALVRARDAGELTDTLSLARVVAQTVGRGDRGIHPATRTFQALRIWVNDELGALDAWLDAVHRHLVPGGRAAVIAFHSLEDRPVKQAFESWTLACTCPPRLPVCVCRRTASWRWVTRKADSPSDDEIQANPRARSAHLRVIERLAEATADGAPAGDRS